MKPIKIRHLMPEDWELWRALRLEALKNHPEAFGSSYEEESAWVSEKFKSALEHHYNLGAFLGEEIVGIAGFFIEPHLKMNHRGILYAVYVKPQGRQLGVARNLVRHIIDQARGKVLQVHCAVTFGNEKALKLYQDLGFEIYGIEPRSIKVKEAFFDEYLMVLKL